MEVTTLAEQAREETTQMEEFPALTILAELAHEEITQRTIAQRTRGDLEVMPPTELAREEEKFLALTVLAPIFGRAWTDRISLLLLDSPTGLEMDPGRAWTDRISLLLLDSPTEMVVAELAAQ